MHILVKVLHHDGDFDLKVELVSGSGGLSRRITKARVQKPGLALAGFVESVRPGCIQVLGNTEMKYLDSLTPQAQTQALEGFFNCPNLACVVLTNGRTPPQQMRDLSDNTSVPVFCTPLPTETFINRVQSLLDEYLSPEVTVHGVVIDVFGVGVMLTGQSGIGKSECALDLVLRGHRLVADDVVRIKQMGSTLLATGSPVTGYHMEVRGLGIINVLDLFGAAAVRKTKRVELVVEMVEWQPGVEYDRTGVDSITQSFLDTAIPKIRLPIRPGRNVASIVEVAARNHLLKLQGHDSALLFKESLEQRLAGTSLSRDIE